MHKMKLANAMSPPMTIIERINASTATTNPATAIGLSVELLDGGSTDVKGVPDGAGGNLGVGGADLGASFGTWSRIIGRRYPSCRGDTS
jgi:hypothetical protein